jgi:hypothetical protein
MVSSGMLRRVAFVRTDVSEELSASFIRVKRIGELGTTLAAGSNRHTLRRNTKALSSSETSVLTRAIRRNIPEDNILHSHCRENLKSYVGLGLFTVNTARFKDTVMSQRGSRLCPERFWELIRDFHNLLRQKPPSLLIL